MSKKLSKVIALLLTTALSVSVFAACGTKTDDSSQTSSSSTATAAAASDSTEKLKPITFTMFSNDPAQKAFGWDGAVAKKITELTGVTLNIEVLNGMDQEQKRSVMVAGGDFPDLLSNVENKWTDGGALIPLDELIDKYGANIKKQWGASLDKLRYEKDGKIYFIGALQNRPTEVSDANQCLLIQYDVLDKLGYPKLETLDDVYKALKDYTAKVKDLNGKSFIPWGMWADTWGYNITVNNPALWVNGFSDDSDAYVNPETYDVKYFNSTDYFKNYLKWLNKLYNEKMIDKNSFIMKNDQMKSLASTGRILAMIDGTWDVTDVEAALRKAGMPERCYARFPIVAQKGIADRSQVYSESYSKGIGISPNCKDTERAMKFLDWAQSDEGTVLLNWGIEGVHYDKVNGKRILKPEIAKKINSEPDYKWKEGFQFYWNQCQAASKLDDGDYAIAFNPETVYQGSDEWTKKVMDKYGIKYWGQNFKVDGKTNPYGFAWTINIPQGSAGQVSNQKADQIRHAAVPTIISAKNDSEFESKWKDFQSKLTNEAKISDYEKSMTELIKKRLELWKATK